MLDLVLYLQLTVNNESLALLWFSEFRELKEICQTLFAVLFQLSDVIGFVLTGEKGCLGSPGINGTIGPPGYNGSKGEVNRK